MIKLDLINVQKIANIRCKNMNNEKVTKGRFEGVPPIVLTMYKSVYNLALKWKINDISFSICICLRDSVARKTFICS